jgi:fermentation-respiration switch protein FrsA (DUF1100 family)
MIHALHLLIVAVYLVLPAVVWARAMVLSVRKGRRAPIRLFWVTGFSGLVMASLICSMYAMSMHGRLIPTQVILAAYFATGLLLLLKGFDRLLWGLARWGFRLRRDAGPRWWRGVRTSAALLLRTIVLFGIGLPYVLAAALTYRPKVVENQTPQTLFNWSFERIAFSATDGMHISGWWIPASGGASSQTVVLCPGQSGGKAMQLFLARRLIPAGYNVLVFDFRAHGESAGQITSYGDLERRDVLGAVRWLRANHPSACQKVVGLGVSTGGAALIEAAADPGPEGQNIDAIAVYGSFDRLDAVVESITQDYLPPPLGWLVQHIGLPLASVQTGADLQAFAPAQAVKALWPRPILVIHGLDDQVIPFERGEALFDAALQPRYNDWIEHGGHLEVMENSEVARWVRRYFDAARRLL